MLSTPAKAECNEVIQQCDLAIQKQGELIDLLVERNSILEVSLRNEKEANARSAEREVWLVIGAGLAGALVYGLSTR